MYRPAGRDRQYYTALGIAVRVADLLHPSVSFYSIVMHYATAQRQEAARVWPDGYCGDPGAGQGNFIPASTHDLRYQFKVTFVADVAEAA